MHILYRKLYIYSMIRPILFLALLCCASLALGQTTTFDYSAYKQIPPNYRNHDSLALHIVPDRPCAYWAYVRSYGVDDDDPPFYSQGIKPAGLRFKMPNQGFFYGCIPGLCFAYIGYVRDGGVGYVTTPKEYAQFIGKVDNLEEAVLLCLLDDRVMVDTEFKGAAYKKTKDGYEFVLCKYTPCPQNFEAIHYTLNGATITKKESLGVYRTLPGCVMY